jgi:hypothetical protein
MLVAEDIVILLARLLVSHAPQRLQAPFAFNRTGTVAGKAGAAAEDLPSNFGQVSPSD